MKGAFCIPSIGGSSGHRGVIKRRLRRRVCWSAKRPACVGRAKDQIRRARVEQLSVLITSRNTEKLALEAAPGRIANPQHAAR